MAAHNEYQFNKWFEHTFKRDRNRWGRPLPHWMDRVISHAAAEIRAENDARNNRIYAEELKKYEADFEQYKKDKAAYDAAKARYLENLTADATASVAAQEAAHAELEKHKSPTVTAAMGKVFSPQHDVIRYSKTGDATNWNEERDAGFLPSGRNTASSVSVVCVAMHENDLIVFMPEQLQVWAVDADPANMRLKNTIHNIYCISAATVCNVGNDLYFLTRNGFRSLKMNEYGENRAEYDIGSPIDDIAKAAIANNPQHLYASCYYSYIGAYMCAIGSQLFVFTQNQPSRIAAWSIWTVGAAIVHFVPIGNDLYCVDVQGNFYKFTPTASDDAGVPFEVVAQIPFMDFKSPGILKMLIGVDAIVDGQCDVHIAPNADYPDEFVHIEALSGNTRPRGLIPAHMSGTEFSIKFTAAHSQPLQLHSVSVYYENMGNV